MASDFLPALRGGLLPDRATDKALAEIDRRATVIEAAAERKIELAARLNHKAKLQYTVASATTAQLARVEPRAGEVLALLDLELAETLAQTFRKAVS